MHSSIFSDKRMKKSLNQRKEQRESIQNYFNQKYEEINIENGASPQKSLSEQVEREKKLRKKTQKELQQLEKRYRQAKETIRKQRAETKFQKTKQHKLHKQHVYAQSQQAYAKELEDALKKRDKDIEKEQSRCEALKKTIHALEQEKRILQKSGKKFPQMTNQIKQLKQHNQSLKKQLEDHQLLTEQEYGDMRKQITDLQNELRIYRDRQSRFETDPAAFLAKFEKGLTGDQLPRLLKMVENHITTKNLRYFYRGNYNVFYFMMRRTNLLKYRVQQRQHTYRIRRHHLQEENDRLGYLKRDMDDQWFFIDMTDTSHTKRYPATVNETVGQLVSESPARASIVGGEAVITRLFTIKNHAEPRKLKRKSANATGKKNYHLFGNFKVLLIGSRYLNDYRDRLLKHGCLVEVHNPFEESFEILSGKVGRAEIILVCERHVPHGVWNYVDRKQPFVSVLKNDSKDLVSAHTYLSLQRCELL